MRYVYLTLLLTLFIWSCGSITQIGDTNDTTLPFLSNLGVERGNILSTNFHQAGTPDLDQKTPLVVSNPQFNKTMYKKYAALMDRSGVSPYFQYVDSLPVKPKYFTLEIGDEILLQENFNSVSNKRVRDYISLENEIGIVTNVSFIYTAVNATSLINADGVFLVKDKNGVLSLEVFNEGKKAIIDITDLKVFDYELSNFCWSLDRYGNPTIATIVDKPSQCPKGTKNKANKLEKNQSYLKL
ncbi:hypothetical protein [Cytophaga sp. FL35]|uniref:hypothetical protein n=1 Tax=Cytophaga sp. FL35 TaxID=1904456 RepID=UPI001653C471|nr:hypothetical protein [Cytophaga sp. FL35]MBC6999640.1 hypothetical protein [Cytophaga sp. FL35]